MENILNQDIQFLPGVGPKRAELLIKELKINTFRDLIYYFPFKYIDRTKFYKISEINPQMAYIQIKGKITQFETVGAGLKQRLTASFSDGTGNLELVWFQGIKYQKQNLKLNQEYTVFGKPSIFNGKINIVHPEMETEDLKGIKQTGIFQSFYITTENMKKKFVNSKAINKLQLTLLDKVSGKIKETLPQYLIEKVKVTNLNNALINIHKPENTFELKKARYRLKFEELFFIQLKILNLKLQREDRFKGFRFSKIGYNFNTFYKKHLPFELTNAQKKVLREIRNDIGGTHQMNRLLQGDVGSGKTLVALMSMLMAVDNDYQACLMAPTEILAQQHYMTIETMLNGLNLDIGLLTGSTNTSERKNLHEKLKTGKLHILIGTHALIEDTVLFHKLGMVVIDEQHRFGVAQRASLWKKNTGIPPHVLVMTATPIPRTLAMTVYGDLDVSVINQLPPGRKQVKTIHFFENNRNKLYEFLKNQIKKGSQAYIVYPLITESEKMDYKNLEEGFRNLNKTFPEFKISMVHGRMKPKHKDQEMNKFKEGKTQILVATTVIEVGVDVPNASIMIIESSERYGLSQLHQLRGRVGRGSEQSYCILMSSHKLSAESRKRLNTMVNTNDGFEIAEVDMKLRGPGDMEGTQQSGIGFDLKIANLSQDSEILKLARDTAKEVLKKDPNLKNPENKLLAEYIITQKTEFDWGNIS